MAGSAPTGIVVGPDGALWVTEENDDRIARVTTTGTVSEFALARPGAPGLSIVSGPDGALWFSDRDADEVDRMTLTGSVQATYLTHGSSPLGICNGPLQSLWVTQSRTGELDRVARGRLGDAGRAAWGHRVADRDRAGR